MKELALNNPLVRQDLLSQRLQEGKQLIASDLAREFDISLDTIRRDLLALEDQGLVQRVRGGAVAVRKPAATFTERLSEPPNDCSKIVPAAIPLIKEGMTIILDGGTTLAHLAELLPALPNLLVITPSPVIASILLQKNIATHLIGGRISPWGGVAVGGDAVHALGKLAADLAFIGICGLHAQFGLASDYADEADLMRAMATSADDTVLVCSKEKIGQRARHQVLSPEQLSIIITDADVATMQPFKEAGAEILHV
ncbi:DeoR/GlpR family DNA-binding transcription regulator [Cohaesibacter celericrescens]|uniref:DeoR family transcriptional regulator n=1 Tax=Cohaesibacter celericrescens TaxID=2067669 RepID=A0A2N5XTP1_9HYPH|nr:DeoR/GlpR family DNA-binding transcription regulator [Cohaesibacter celericrescens]PLW77778.1 DeoR family transcriptional regulator [Cohaesibacter celericrescens]